MTDLRDAFRALRASPIVSAVAVLSLALGIGANSAMFSILDRLLLRALPVRQPQQLVQLTDGSWTNPIWEQIRDRTTRPSEGAERGAGGPADSIFDGMFAWSSFERFDLASGGPTEFVDALWASGRMFDVLGVPAILGRTFTAADDRRGGGPDGPVAVISYRFWQRHYGGAADAVGRSITLDRVPFTVIGVTPPDFFGPDVGRDFDVAVPLGDEPIVRGKESALDQKGYWWLSIMGRLKPGQTVESADEALRAVQPQIREATMPTDWRPESVARYLKDPFTFAPAAGGDSPLRSRYARPLYVLMGVVGLVLLIACANIANLLLARASARRHELSIRLALGASRWRLARQLFAESVLLAGLGALLGLVFARWGSALLVAQLSSSSRHVFLDLGTDWRIVGFTSAVAVATAVLFGTVPAWRATRAQPSEALKAQGRAIAGERRQGLGQTLVIAQVALSLVLVAGAGLFLRTFASLSTRDPGFDRHGLLVVDVNAAATGTEPAARPALFERVREAAATLPGVSDAAVSVVTPVSGMTWMFGLSVVGGPELPEDKRGAHINMVSPGWFATYRTRLLAGRDLTAADRAGAPAVAVVNEAFVRRFIPGTGNPLGRVIVRPPRPGQTQPPVEIVGLVQDAVYQSLRDPVPPTAYLPLAQMDNPRLEAYLTVRAASGPPALLTRSVAGALASVDPALSLTFRTLDDQVDASLTQERLVAMLSGFFGALALLLAGLGLYGVMSHAVSRQRTEIGIRLALGASPRGVVGMVLGRVGVLVAAGVAAGCVATLWAAGFARTLLWGIEPRDPVTLAVAAAVLVAVGALAGWLPARRASRVDPATVLREG